MTSTRYALARPQSAAFALGFTVLLASVGVWVMLRGAGSDQPTWYRILFGAAWLAIAMYVGYRQATSASEIIVHENDEVEFVSLLKRVRMPALTIESIRASAGRYDQLVVRHHDGSIHLAGAFNEFHQFLTELKRVNPGVELVGC